MTNNLIPELDNREEIEKLISSDLQAQRDKAMIKALQNVTLGIVNSRFALSGLKTVIGHVEERIGDLNKNINDSSESSDKLTEAIKKITLWGTIIAGAGVLIALLNLCFEVYKYLQSTQ
jgi:hypothetical protein